MSNIPKNDKEGGSTDKYPHELTIEQVRDDAPLELTHEEEKRLWHKVDRRLVPILSLMYLLSFMDRGNIGNAKLEGLLKQLDLTGNRFNIALTMYFISYATFECISNLFLKVFRPSRWLPGIMVLWGVVMTLMGLVKTYPQLVGVRFCLGVAEAGLYPGVVYYLSLWYPRHLLQYRIALFFVAATIAGAFSGLFAFGVSYMWGAGGLEGWSWIFIIEGLMTIVVACAAFFLIVDSPSSTTFLTPDERAYLEWRKKYDNSTVGEDEFFSLRHIKDVLTDWQIYFFVPVSFSIVAPVYGITYFLPTIINDFGYDTAVSQLLTVPQYVVASVVVLVSAHCSDKLKMRSPFIYACYILLLIGYAINISSTSNGVKYFGTFFIVVGGYTPAPGVVAWVGNNLAGRYKRAIGMAFVIGTGNFAGAIASNIFLTQDAPRYTLGFALEMMFVGIGMIAVPILVILYKRINNARDDAQRLRAEQGEKLNLTIQEFRDLGDRAPDFRYTL